MSDKRIMPDMSSMKIDRSSLDDSALDSFRDDPIYNLMISAYNGLQRGVMPVNHPAIVMEYLSELPRGLEGTRVPKQYKQLVEALDYDDLLAVKDQVDRYIEKIGYNYSQNEDSPLSLISDDEVMREARKTMSEDEIRHVIEDAYDSSKENNESSEDDDTKSEVENDIENEEKAAIQKKPTQKKPSNKRESNIMTIMKKKGNGNKKIAQIQKPPVDKAEQPMDDFIGGVMAMGQEVGQTLSDLHSTSLNNTDPERGAVLMKASYHMVKIANEIEELNELLGIEDDNEENEDDEGDDEE